MLFLHLSLAFALFYLVYIVLTYFLLSSFHNKASLQANDLSSRVTSDLNFLSKSLPESESLDDYSLVALLDTKTWAYGINENLFSMVEPSESINQFFSQYLLKINDLALENKISKFDQSELIKLMEVKEKSINGQIEVFNKSVADYNRKAHFFSACPVTFKATSMPKRLTYLPVISESYVIGNKRTK